MRTPLTLEQRTAIVEEAKTWLGTPFHHAADVKGAGVDCGMILVRVFCDLGIAPWFDPRPYAAQWFMHQGEERYMNWIKKYCDQIEESEAQPADLQLYRFGRCAAHAAIIINKDLMLHAYLPSRRVELRERRANLVHGHVDSWWSPRIVA